MIIYNRCWVGTKQQSFTLWLFTTYVDLALNNNHSLTPMIIYNRCWVDAKQQSIYHSMIIYNRSWVGALKQSLI
jgi:hypothetical protein